MSQIAISADRLPVWFARTTLILRLALALALVAAGTAKLVGVTDMVELFEAIGLGQWFRFFTTAVEIGAAVLLIMPRTVGLGAVLSMATMACAALTHIAWIGGSPVPAIALMSISAFVSWAHRGDVVRQFVTNSRSAG